MIIFPISFVKLSLYNTFYSYGPKQCFEGTALYIEVLYNNKGNSQVWINKHF